MNHRIILPAFALLSLVSCHRFAEFVNPDANEDIVIKTGTYYEMCSGYCMMETIIREAGVRLREWSYKHEAKWYPERSKVVTMSSTDWQDLVSAIDMGALTALDSNLLDPHCFDCGGEWIEVRKGTQTKRIVFQPDKTVPEVSALIEKIRTIRKRAKF